MRYIVLENKYLWDLVKEVNINLKEGWVLQGGVSTGVRNGSYKYYIQAMVKND